jgi:glycerophosphoryl diester phosphodiesterase
MYLSEVMKQNQTKLIIDIKTPNNKLRASQIAEKALKLVEQMNAEPWVEFLTGELAVAQILINKTTLPVAYLGTYSKAIDQMKPEYVSNLNLRFIDYRYIHFKNNQKWIKSFKKMNFYTNAWVVNEEEDMEWFINQDFDYITTDEPELLLKICNLNEK